MKVRIERNDRKSGSGLSKIRLHPNGRITENHRDIFLARLKAQLGAVTFSDFAHTLKKVSPIATLPLLIFIPLQGVQRRITFRAAF
jgi:hypothetical protein